MKIEDAVERLRGSRREGGLVMEPLVGADSLADVEAVEAAGQGMQV
jgi:hypothetical protein